MDSFPHSPLTPTPLCYDMSKQDLQDEVMSLNIQLNVAELRAQELTKDNQRLVDRWMARMGKEADAMNEASKFA